jgi:hypothetical protein
MKEYGSNRISVLFFYDGDDDYARPMRLLWQDREYELAPVKFWHSTQHDGHMRHHYMVSDVDYEYTFQLVLETEAMTWRLAQAVPTSVETEELPVMNLHTKFMGAAA